MTDLALSSFWMRGRWERFADFTGIAAALGFGAFEVSGLLGDTFYDEVRPGQINIVSFHNPAPPQRGARAADGRQGAAPGRHHPDLAG